MMKKKRSAGFSLMEMVVAIGVFSLAMLTLAFAFGRDVLHVKRLYQEEVATQIIQGQLEALRAKPYNDLKDCVDAQVNLAALIPESAAQASKAPNMSPQRPRGETQQKVEGATTDSSSASVGLTKSAKCTVTIEEYDPQDPGLKKVKVTLQWFGGSKKLKQRTMETLIADVAR